MHARQSGVVLLISLIILVALTIGGVALVRSVDTTSIISGNLAFQQAATHAGEAGTARAILYLESVPSPYTALHNDVSAQGYSASTPSGTWFVAGNTAGNPANWDAYWATVIDPLPVAAAGVCQNRVCTLPVDAAGNVVSYTIQRLCQAAGDPLMGPTGCATVFDPAKTKGTSLDPNSVPLKTVPKYYYRITTRVAGPRNTTSYIQTIVAR